MNAETYEQKLNAVRIHRGSVAYKLAASVLQGHMFLRPCYRQGFNIRDYSRDTILVLKEIGVDFHIGNDGERLGAVNQYIRIEDKELYQDLQSVVPNSIDEIISSAAQRDELRMRFDEMKAIEGETWTQTRSRVLESLSDPDLRKENADVLQIVVNHIRYKRKSNGNK